MKQIGDSSSYICRGLSANWESFRELIDDISENYSFDIIGLSEVYKCNNDNRPQLPGFHKLITSTRPESNRGGVGFFIGENIDFKIREDFHSSCFRITICRNIIKLKSS